jgi:hypothetical protein
MRVSFVVVREQDNREGGKMKWGIGARASSPPFITKADEDARAPIFLSRPIDMAIEVSILFAP